MGAVQDLRRPASTALPRALPFSSSKEGIPMQAPAKGCLAGLVAWKLGGGILTTILIFVAIYYLLGNC